MSIRITGLNEALKNIEKKGDDAVRGVKKILANEATDIELNAKINAKKTFGGEQLSYYQRINKVVDPGSKGLSWKVGLETENKDFEIEAWLEFGTGLSAKQLLSGSEYDEDIRKLALTFFRDGRGTIPASPYLFPAFFKVRSRIVDKIKKEIEKNLR